LTSNATSNVSNAWDTFREAVEPIFNASKDIAINLSNRVLDVMLSTRNIKMTATSF